jgi:hypothetical protein
MRSRQAFTVVGALGLGLLVSCGGSSTPASPAPSTSSSPSTSASPSAPVTPTATPSVVVTPDIAGVTVVNGLPHTHFLGVHLTYSRTPPLGGDHSPVPLTCAIYTQPVPNENAVHSLEHGAVWLTYLPGTDPAPLVALDKIDPSYVLISPYPGQPAKVVASAWGLQLKVDSATDPRLRAFVEKYHGGSQGGEPGAVCTGEQSSVTPAQAGALLAQGPPAGQPTPPVPADKTSGS